MAAIVVQRADDLVLAGTEMDFEDSRVSAVR
jgi:hypothetical protein